MILVTVGGQMPFDRLVRAVDEWAGSRHRDDVFAQIGRTALRPVHIQWTDFLPPAEMRARFDAASLIVAHAGTGSILMALECCKRIIIMPRRSDLRETRHDHQIATAKGFSTFRNLAVALDAAELWAHLDNHESLTLDKPISCSASPHLIRAILDFVNALPA